MSRISAETVRLYQEQAFRLPPEKRIKTRDQAVDFVNERGFIYFWPITGVRFPSLWAAVAGDRPVADAHDDPGHITWEWKDSLLGGDCWYYGKILRKKATMISFEVVPYFYALSENYGSPEDDYLTLYEQGRMTLESKTVYEALLEKGPLDTVALRRVTHMSSPNSESRFNRAMTDLQADFKILPVGVTQSGAWHYAFLYDLVTRHYPEIPSHAHSIREADARVKLVYLFFHSLGIAQSNDVFRLFGWRTSDTEKAVESLAQRGILCMDIQLEGQAGEWIALKELV